MRAVLTGAAGMLGSSIVRAWEEQRPGDELVPLTRARVDLRNREAVAAQLQELRPDAVIHAAAVVGGISAKLAHPTRYLLDNLLIDSAVFSGCIAAGIPSMLYIASAAAYPEHAEQPLRPESLLGGALEPANEPYGLAKLAGIQLCQYAAREHGLAYRAVLPSNLYGPADHYNAEVSHLVAAALKKVHDAHAERRAEVVIWGDGRSRRELLFAPDLADWLVSSVHRIADWPTVLNVGVGEDEAIDRFYELAAEIVGFEGRLVHDLDKPNGARRRLLDSSPARELGWSPRTSLRQGMEQCYAALRTTLNEVR